MQVIGLSGYARSGKDTVARILVEQYGFTRVAYADALRDVALRTDPYITSAGTKLSTVVASYGWERAKDNIPEVRRVLQHLGVAVRDVVHTDAWVNAAIRKMEVEDGRYVVPDVRFPNELTAVRARGIAVRVERPGFGPVNGHVSETAIDDGPFDYILKNDSTAAALRLRVADMLVWAKEAA